MIVKSFIPFIITKNSEEVIQTFETLGFVKGHTKADANFGQNPTVTMKNAEGFKVDIAQSDNVTRDIQSIRINVDDFEVAYQGLLGKGFKNPKGDYIAESSTDKAAMMISPSGFTVIICQHIA